MQKVMKKMNYGILILLMIALTLDSCISGSKQSLTLTKKQTDSIEIAKYCEMSNDFFGHNVTRDLDQVPNNAVMIYLPGEQYQGMTLKECVDRWGAPSYCMPFNDCDEGRYKDNPLFHYMCLEDEYPLYISRTHSHIFAHWDVSIKQFGGLDIEFVVVGNQAFAFALYLFTTWDDFWELPCG